MTHVSRVTCYVLRVTCYVLRVTCYVLRVTYYVFCLKSCVLCLMSKIGNGCAKRDVGTVQVPEGGERRGEIFKG